MRTTLLILLLMAASAAALDRCQCTPANDTQRTAWGQRHGIIQEPKPIGELKGTVLALMTDPLPDVLVEVFDHPEAVSHPEIWSNEGHEPQSRIAACVTGKDGKFCFRLPDGKYELRCSKSDKQEGWNITSYLVEIKHGARRKQLRVPLRLAD